MAEAHATLSGDKRLGINPRDASRMVRDAAAIPEVDTLDATSLLELIRQAPGRGVYGGIFFDAIHALWAPLAGTAQQVCPRRGSCRGERTADDAPLRFQGF